MNIAIIPARGGSKRIPRKNIKLFCGKPMIAWSIEAAQKAEVFDAILVSTDDDEIATIAEDLGAEAPFRRPAELANDHTATVPVIGHALSWFAKNRGTVANACCIYATAPFLQAQEIQQGLVSLKAHPEVEFAISVTSFAFPIFRALKKNIDDSVEMFWPEHNITRSQDLPEAFHDAGQFYWGRPEAFLTRPGFFSGPSLGVVLPRHRVQDIDTPEDWERAEAMFRVLANQNNG